MSFDVVRGAVASGFWQVHGVIVIEVVRDWLLRCWGIFALEPPPFTGSCVSRGSEGKVSTPDATQKAMQSAIRDRKEAEESDAIKKESAKSRSK